MKDTRQCVLCVQAARQQCQSRLSQSSVQLSSAQQGDITVSRLAQLSSAQCQQPTLACNTQGGTVVTDTRQIAEREEHDGVKMCHCHCLSDEECHRDESAPSD